MANTMALLSASWSGVLRWVDSGNLRRADSDCVLHVRAKAMAGLQLRAAALHYHLTYCLLESSDWNEHDGEAA